MFSTKIQPIIYELIFCNAEDIHQWKKTLLVNFTIHMKIIIIKKINGNWTKI